jgi:hypothetical protein
MQKYFGVSALYINRRYDNHNEHLYRYCVRKFDDIFNVIVPFFQRYPLQTAKEKDFEKFVKCVQMIADRQHLSREGLIEIAQIASTMNHQNPRDTLIRILRDYTPNTA